METVTTGSRACRRATTPPHLSTSARMTPPKTLPWWLSWSGIMLSESTVYDSRGVLGGGASAAAGCASFGIVTSVAGEIGVRGGEDGAGRGGAEERRPRAMGIVRREQIGRGHV